MKYVNRILKQITFCFCIILCAASISSSALGYTDERENTANPLLANTDKSKTIKKVSDVSKNTDEMRAVWISFLEYDANGYTENDFQKHIDEMFDKCVSLHMNTVIVHVRPFADAMYSSSCYPWSKYASGKDGRNPGYDPLAYMVKAAHARELKIQAWINPYRITNAGTSTNKLPKNSYAYQWSHSKKSSKRRNVLSYGGKLYYNPATKDVQNLIIKGVKEIVKNYDIDGIHMDDYFYPNMGTEYKKVFDAKEYKKYIKKCKKAGEQPKSIARWRRNNVNVLVKNIYKTIKSINADCPFGISPAGNLDNLYLTCGNYVDVETWMGNKGYIDYICPQIYWSFTQKTCPYRETVNRWLEISRTDDVDVYIGLAAYRAGISTKEAKSLTDTGWSKSTNILKRQVLYNRKTNEVNGFMLFSYQSLIKTESKTKKEIKNLVSVLN